MSVNRVPNSQGVPLLDDHFAATQFGQALVKTLNTSSVGEFLIPTSVLRPLLSVWENLTLLALAGDHGLQSGQIPPFRVKRVLTSVPKPGKVLSIANMRSVELTSLPSRYAFCGYKAA